MRALKVGRRDAENVRRKLADLELINNDYEIKKEGGWIYIPVKNIGDDFFEGKEVVDVELEERKRRPKKLSDLLNTKGLLRSFDIIGDIAIIDVPDEMKGREKEIGAVILGLHKNIKTVLAKESAVKGRYRVRMVKWIAGERKTETVHKEHGCKFAVDVSKVYFSSRLSHERLRIAEQVKNGEHILALFGGAAPFPIVIAKRKYVTAYSIELNPAGHRYALKNIKMNKVEDRVRAIEGDVKKVLEDEKFRGWADRIIMPLPKNAIEFLPYAARAAKKGCIIHVYAFCKKGEIELLKKRIKELIQREADIIFARKVRTYSPEVEQFVFDIKVF